MAAHEYPQDGKDGSGEPVITEHYKTLYYLIIYSVIMMRYYRSAE